MIEPWYNLISELPRELATVLYTQAVDAPAEDEVSRIASEAFVAAANDAATALTIFLNDEDETQVSYDGAVKALEWVADNLIHIDGHIELSRNYGETMLYWANNTTGAPPPYEFEQWDRTLTEHGNALLRYAAEPTRSINYHDAMVAYRWTANHLINLWD